MLSSCLQHRCSTPKLCSSASTRACLSGSPCGPSQLGLLLHGFGSLSSVCSKNYVGLVAACCDVLLYRAVLCCVVLRCAGLCCVVLCRGMLCCCMLQRVLRADKCLSRHGRSGVQNHKRTRQHLTCMLQAFNKGLFDFLIATDDPSKQGADNPRPSPTDSSTAAVASVSQQPEAAAEAAGSLGAEEDGEDAAPDHAWTEAAAAAKSTEVQHRHKFEPLLGSCALSLCCDYSLFFRLCA